MKTTYGTMRRDSAYGHMTRSIKYRNTFTNPLSPKGTIHSTTYDSKAEAIKGAEHGEREFNNNYIKIAEEV